MPQFRRRGTRFITLASVAAAGLGVALIALLPRARAVEPDDTPDQATVIRMGDTLSERVDRAGDRDVFAFDCVAQEEYTVKTSNLVDEMDTIIRLIAPDGETQLAEDDDGGDEQYASAITFTAETDGRYYVEVRHYDGEAAGGGYDVGAEGLQGEDPDAGGGGGVRTTDFFGNEIPEEDAARLAELGVDVRWISYVMPDWKGGDFQEVTNWGPVHGFQPGEGGLSARIFANRTAIDGVDLRRYPVGSIFVKPYYRTDGAQPLPLTPDNLVEVRVWFRVDDRRGISRSDWISTMFAPDGRVWELANGPERHWNTWPEIQTSCYGCHQFAGRESLGDPRRAASIMDRGKHNIFSFSEAGRDAPNPWIRLFPGGEDPVIDVADRPILSAVPEPFRLLGRQLKPGYAVEYTSSDGVRQVDSRITDVSGRGEQTATVAPVALDPGQWFVRVVNRNTAPAGTDDRIDGQPFNTVSKAIPIWIDAPTEGGGGVDPTPPPAPDPTPDPTPDPDPVEPDPGPTVDPVIAEIRERLESRFWSRRRRAVRDAADGNHRALIPDLERMAGSDTSRSVRAAVEIALRRLRGPSSGLTDALREGAEGED